MFGAREAVGVGWKLRYLVPMLNRSATGFRVALALVGLLALPTTFALAGPLTPPAGPVAPTAKPLSEIEPRIAINATNTPGNGLAEFVITQPGSYYFTGNVNTSSKSMLIIRASNVTVDLSGYTLASSGGIGIRPGIVVDLASITNVRILNGSIQGFNGDGIDLGFETTRGCRIENVTVTACGVGFDVSDDTTIINCVARLNTTGGFSLGVGGSIRGSTAVSNGGFGFVLGSAGLATDCVSQDNDGGFGAGDGSTLVRCVAALSTQDGFVVSRATVTECTARSNSGNGFVASGGAAFSGCTALLNVQNGFNITAPRCRLTNCTASDNTGHGVFVDVTGDLAELNILGSTMSNNTLSGITTEASTLIADGNVSNNGTVGIQVLNSCMIRGCTVNTNVQSGIVAAAANIIQNNMVSSNAVGAAGAGAAGILCTADDNRLEGNMLVSNAQDGIRLNAAGNLVIRNTLTRTGTTINAVANNRIAQIITNPASGFVSTDPNANFVY